jgi:O-antigen/teichoic acid export membrane protein
MKLPVVLRATAGTAAWTYLGFALSLLSAPVLAHTLGADGRGVIAACVAPVQVLGWIGFLGLPRPLAVNVVSNNRINYGSVFWLSVLGIIGTLSLNVGATVLSGGDSRIEIGIRIFSPLLVFSGFAQLGAESLHLRSKFLYWNILRSSSLIIPSISTIALYLSGHLTITSAVGSLFLGQLFYVVGGFCASVPALRNLKPGMHQDWGFSLKFWSATVFDSLGGRLDQVLLAALVSTVQLGSYAVAVTCASASGALTQAFNHVAFPGHLSSEDSSSNYKRQALIGIGTSTLSGSAVVAVVALYGTKIFGPTFDDLAAISAILVAYQVAADQWQLIVYRDSAQLKSGRISFASVIGLVLLVISAAVLYSFNLLNAVSMAACMFVFGVSRITAYLLMVRFIRRDVKRADVELTDGHNFEPKSI